MKTYVIDSDNKIVVASGSSSELAGTETFTNAEGLAKLAAQWPATRLVEIWNGLPGVKPVQRFTSSKVAATRIWRAVRAQEPTVRAQARSVASKKPHPRKAPSRPKRPAVREGTKTAKVIALLQQPGGMSMKRLMRATGWQAHSIRALISGQIGKTLGYQVRTFERDGEWCYAIRK